MTIGTGLAHPGNTPSTWLSAAYAAAVESPDPAVVTAVEAVEAVEAAIGAQSVPGLDAAYAGVAGLPKDVLARSSAELGPRLATLLPRMPTYHASYFAVLVGACVEWNADATACAPFILGGLRDSMARAIEFVGLWRARYGADREPPAPDAPPSGKLEEELGAEWARWYAPYFGWCTTHNWERAAVAVLADPQVRAQLENRAELVELTERLEPDFGNLQCAQRALLLLDDEPLLVLHRASGKGFRLRMSGIADNYQLQTLLAAALIGGRHLPGEAPSRAAVAYSTDAPLDPGQVDKLPYTTECFNFAEPSGRWIWSETTPSRIPVTDGVRRLVLDPPVFRHAYRTLRFLPRVPGSLVLEEVLEPAAAAPYFADIRPLMSAEEASRLAADHY